MNIVTWEYYSSLHHIVSETQFEDACALSEKEVKLVIGPYRWNHLDTEAFYFEQFKDCICNVIDKMAEDAKSAKGQGLASVSNDGYSESYVIQTAEQLREELRGSICSWLSGTGLVGAY